MGFGVVSFFGGHEKKMYALNQSNGSRFIVYKWKRILYRKLCFKNAFVGFECGLNSLNFSLLIS